MSDKRIAQGNLSLKWYELFGFNRMSDKLLGAGYSSEICFSTLIDEVGLFKNIRFHI